jgi:beta-lactamase regulating signal transducer with metallopeptidase domain
MGNFLAYELLPIILNMTLTGGAVIVFVLLFRLALRRGPRIFSYALWLVVLFRLLCPVSLTADFSLLRVVDPPLETVGERASAVRYIPRDVVHTPDPSVALPVPGLGEAITETLPQGAEQTVADPLEAPVAIATWVWLLGMGGLAVYGAVSLIRLRRRLTGAVPLETGVYLADHIGTPFVLGLLRPKIYLPSALPEEERDYILLHERHHIRRLDHVVKLLAFLALCIHWFNPLVWVFFRLLEKDMEMSCDEAVVKTLGEGVRADYSASLLRLATDRRGIAGAPLAFGEGDTRERVKNVLRWKRPRLGTVLAGAVTCVLLITACALNPAETPSGEHNRAAEPAQGTYGSAEDAAYYLELAAGGGAFRQMDEARREALLAEYGELLTGYTLLARESEDGQSAYILGAWTGPAEESPLYLMYSVEVGDYQGGTVQVLYGEEDSGAVDTALTEGIIPQAGTIVRDSSLFFSANDFQSSPLILIEPKGVSHSLSPVFNRYQYTPNGPDYIADAVSRGISLTGTPGPCLYVYRISAEYGELAECIPLTEAQLADIESEALLAITPGFGFAAEVHTEEGTILYTEATGVPLTVLDLAVERCDYRFADPGYIRGDVLAAELEGDWLEAPRRVVAEADLSRLTEMLKNAEFGYVGGCGYGAKVTLTFKNGEQFTFFKGTDGCDTVVFGSYSGYFLGDAENTEFWQIFGLDPETKEPLAA